MSQPPWAGFRRLTTSTTRETIWVNTNRIAYVQLTNTGARIVFNADFLDVAETQDKLRQTRRPADPIAYRSQRASWRTWDGFRDELVRAERSVVGTATKVAVARECDVNERTITRIMRSFGLPPGSWPPSTWPFAASDLPDPAVADKSRAGARLYTAWMLRNTRRRDDRANDA